MTDVPSTAGPAHALHRGFCRGVRDLVMRLDPDKENECIDHYMKVNPQIKNRAMARDTVINNKNYKEHHKVAARLKYHLKAPGQVALC